MHNQPNIRSEALRGYRYTGTCLEDIQFEFIPGLMCGFSGPMVLWLSDQLNDLFYILKDKVRQAKWLKDSGSEHLTTDTARMLSEVTLKVSTKDAKLKFFFLHFAVFA